jgi:hypothetical protein
MSKQNEVGQVDVHSELCMLYYNIMFGCPRYSSMNPHCLDKLSEQQSCKSLKKQQIQHGPPEREAGGKGLQEILHLLHLELLLLYSLQRTEGEEAYDLVLLYSRFLICSFPYFCFRASCWLRLCLYILL